MVYWETFNFQRAAMVAIAILLFWIAVSSTGSYGTSLLHASGNLQSNSGSSKHGRHPDYFIIGCPKCGTTSLQDLFRSNKGLCTFDHKESHYFDKLKNYNVGPKFWQYRSRCHHGYLDATPAYFATPEVPERMIESFTPLEAKKKKFILILRDPVVRAYSWYNHMLGICIMSLRRYFKDKHNNTMPAAGWNVTDMCEVDHCVPLKCRENGQFMQITQERKYLSSFKDYEHPVEVGFYDEHLARWMRHFSRDQLFIVNFDTLVANTPDTMKRMVQFLGLPIGFPNDVELPKDNAAKFSGAADCVTRDWLTELYAPHLQGLYAFLEGNFSAESPFMKAAEKHHLAGVVPNIGNKPASEPPFPRFSHFLSCSPTDVAK
jgi:hypothetical protein